VRFRELAVPGVVEFIPQVFPDARGQFVAPFQESTFLDATGHPLHLAQSKPQRLPPRRDLRGALL
jgi:5-epimerase